MTPSPQPVHSPTRRGEGSSFPRATLTVVLAAVALLGVAGPTFGGLAPPGGPVPTPLSWTNGVVLCNFTADHPAVTVSALGAAGTGLYLGFYEIDEVSPSGAVVANASLFGTTWTIANLSDASMLTLGYTSTAPVRTTPGAGMVGSVGVAVDMSTAYDSDSSANTSFVALHLVITGWPWVSSGDSLSVQAPIWPAFPSAERLSNVSSGAAELQDTSRNGGTPLEYVQWDPTALTTGASRASTTVPARAHIDFGTSYTTITWNFGSASGGATSLAFDSRVGIVLPQRVLGIPLYEYALAAGAAGIVALVAAGSLRRVRRRPSSLEFVEVEER
jgi:hypothetical protein